MSTYLYQLIADFIVFKLIDSFAKSAIHDATNDGEKRRIWFYESGFLAAVSFPIYLLDHTPYLLWVLTVCTFLFTQLIGQLHLLYWWNLLKTRWDEHLQHQESLERLQNNSAISVPPMPASPPPPPPVPNRGVPGMTPPFAGHQMMPQPPSVSNYDHLLPNSSAVMSSQYGHAKPVGLGGPQAAYMGLPHQFSDNHMLTPPQQQQKHLFHHSPQSGGKNSSGYFPDNVTVCPPNVPLGQENAGALWPHNMRRRPLRPSVLRSASPFPVNPPPQPQGFKPVKEVSFKEKLLSKFGFMSKTPPGLDNDCQNQCFMNCVLQCLARSPHLVSQLLMVNVDRIPNVSPEERQFLSEFVKILSKCSAESGSARVVDTEQLKLASQMMKCNLLNGHVQQDAAEFLMWLLTTTHNILNKIHLSKVYGEGKMNHKTPTQNDFYNDFNVENIHKLKVAYKEKIDKLNNFDTEGYAELAQHLSDLDWYAYKNENSSIIDNLFTGQLLEAYNCSRKGHLTIHPQAFAVLPIPLGESLSDSNNIYLEDCFSIFSSVEQLSNQVCSRCSKLNSAEHSMPVMSPVSYVPPYMNTPTTLPPFHMGPSYMSPIASNKPDGGYFPPPHNVRTSTPRLYGSECGPMAQEKQIVDRRCLLHQLPECLIIQLLRFTFDSNTKSTRKILTPVNITLTDLDLKDIVFNLNNSNSNKGHHIDDPNPCHRYNLYAVCVHLSSRGSNGGHYISYCLDSNGKWYKFDDDTVSQVDMQYELTTRTLNENAYLLFYKKCR
ncbi:uncharacterized protein LOC115210304 [Argonauta hians]